MMVTVRSTVGALGILVAGFLGFGAVDELVGRGIRGGEVQPLIIGVAGAVVSLILGLAALALWLQSRDARRLAIVAAAAAIVFHGYAALPPHRNVGLLVLVVVGLYSAALLAIAVGRGPDTREDEAGVRRG